MRSPTDGLPLHIKGRASAAHTLVTLFVIAFATLPAQSLGEEPTSQRGLQEVVVTAEKRSESVLSVPLSITAISSDTIQAADIRDFEGYALKAPNVTFSYSQGQGTTESRSIAIRGIQGANTTGFYVDDLPLPAGVDPYALDLERIEILRGPQGTLYGAGSMGGTVRLITKTPDPSRFAALAHAQFTDGAGEGPGYQVDGSLNAALGDKAAVRLSGFSLTQGGYFDRVFPNPQNPAELETVSHVARLDEYGGTLSLFWKPTDYLTVRPLVMYQHAERNGLPLADYEPSNPIQRRLFDIPEGTSDEWTIAGLTIDLNFDAGEITSATSYFNRHVFENEEASDVTAYLLNFSPPLPAAIQTWEPQHEFVEELRFASKFRGPFQLVAGLFYAYQEQGFSQYFNVPGLSMVNNAEFGTDLGYLTNNPNSSWDRAAFGELSYAISSKWTATLGFRYSDTSQEYTRQADGVFNGGPSYNSGGASETSRTPKAVIKYQPTKDQNYYALAAKGFRPGGPNGPLPELCAADLAALGVTFAEAMSFQSDSVWNYEVGAKVQLPDQRLNLSTALFWIDWKNIQQLVRLPTCGFSYVGNAGAAVSRGAEFELAAEPFTGLSATLGVGYTDAKITETAPDVAVYVGEPVQQVAPWTVSASLQYEHDLGGGYHGIFRADEAYVDNSYSAANDQLHQRLRPAYNILNLRAGFGRSKWEAFLFANNVTNARPNLSDNQSQAAELPGRPRILTSPPRTYGIEVRARFH
jgi:iron complex outermembrane recepter protein